MSATKSIVSLLVGIARDKGFIKSIDQPILDFFPNYKVKRGEKTIQQVTLKQVLTMTAPYNYKYEPWVKMCTSEDWAIAALDLVGGRKGITGEFKYATLGIQLLGGIIFETSGMKLVDFANTYLFEPIGVERHENYYAKSAQEHKLFTISKMPKEHIWFADPQGIGAVGYGLCLTAKDMAKIGQLCLDKGFYNGKQIISAEWFDKMTEPNYHCDGQFGNMMYGYFWWIIDEK